MATKVLKIESHFTMKHRTFKCKNFTCTLNSRIEVIQVLLFHLFFKILIIHLRERAWEHAQAGGVGSRQREREKPTPCWAENPDAGLSPRTLGSWPEPTADVSLTEPPWWLLFHLYNHCTFPYFKSVVELQEQVVPLPHPGMETGSAPKTAQVVPKSCVQPCFQNQCRRLGLSKCVETQLCNRVLWNNFHLAYDVY